MEEGDLEKREVEGGNSLEKAGLLYYCEGPWGLGGIEEGEGVGAHEAQMGHRRGCVRALKVDQEVDAGTAVEEVWFWDKSLAKVREGWAVGGGSSWAHLLRLQTGVEGAQVEWGAEEAVSPVLEVTCYPCPPQCGRLACAPAGNGRTLRWFPAPRRRDAPLQLTAGGADGFPRERCGARSFLDPESHRAAATPALRCPQGPLTGAL